jgi:small redox-active disulfide protein 2
MASKCCAPGGPRRLRVGNGTVSISGLDQLLQGAFDEGWQPEREGVAQHLLAGLRAAGNYIPANVEAAYESALVAAFREFFNAHRPERRGAGGGIVRIEILGPGCARCRATEENVRQALAELKVEAEVVHITDMLEIGRRRVMLTPGVIIDGQLRASGRVPEVTEIKNWLAGVTA